MVSNILHSRKHNYNMLKQMILSIISALHLGLNPLYSTLRFDLLALKKQRLVLGMPLTVLTQLFRNMHANIAWRGMLIRISGQFIKMVQTSRLFSQKICMSQHWFSEQSKLGSVTPRSPGSGDLVKPWMMKYGWMSVSYSLSSFKHVICSYITQLTGYIGCVLRPNLKDGWKSKIAYTMRLIGLLLIFITRQTHGGSLC